MGISDAQASTGGEVAGLTEPGRPASVGIASVTVAGVVSNALRLALVPLLAVGALPVIDLVTGGHSSAAVMAAMADPLSVMAARSPGGRAAGALTQSKPLRAPQERVLAEALTRPLRPTDAPGSGGGPYPSDLVAPLSPGEALPVTGVPDGVVDVAQGPVGSGYFPGGGGGIVPGIDVVPGFSVGGGGGDTPSTPVTTVPVTPANPVASVPEQATWMSLMLGFGAIGGALRTRRRRVAFRR